MQRIARCRASLRDLAIQLWNFFTIFLTGLFKRTISIHAETLDANHQSSKISVKTSNGKKTALSSLKLFFLQSLHEKNPLIEIYASQSKPLCMQLKINKPVQIWVSEHFEFMYMIFPILGAMMILIPGKLVENDLFLITCGAICGILIAFIFFIYYVQNLIRRNLYTSMALGYTITFFPIMIGYLVKKYANTRYNMVFICYFLLSGGVGGAMAYLYAPITNQRLKRLLKLLIFVFGIILQFSHGSFELTCSTLASILTIILLKNFDIFNLNGPEVISYSNI